MLSKKNIFLCEILFHLNLLFKNLGLVNYYYYYFYFLKEVSYSSRLHLFDQTYSKTVSL